jgi:hypothetical protein
VIANPDGHTPKTARDLLLSERVKNGIKRQTILEAAAQKFHDEVFDVMTEAHKEGLLTDEQMALIRGNRNTYATFVPLEFVDSYVPAGIYQQSGTLKDIASPFLMTVLKVLTMQRAIQFQRLKTSTVNLLKGDFADEVQAAETRTLDGGRKEPLRPKDPAMAQIMVREAGTPAWYNVPKEIALMFDHTPVSILEGTIDVLNTYFRKYLYPLYITYNPKFQYWTNPIRDARRSLLTGVGFWSIARQLPLIKHIKQFGPNPALDAVRDLVKRGKQQPIIAEMLDNLAITPGEASFSVTAAEPNSAFDHLLKEHGLLPPDKQRWTDWPVFKQLHKVGEAIKTAGKMNEILLKVAVYRKLRVEGNLSPSDAAFFIRNQIGTPNYGRKGKHVSIVNGIYPFFNIFTKGWAADLQLMRKGWRPKASPPKKGAREPFNVSRSGFFFRWAAFSLVPRLLQIAARMGIIGGAAYGIKRAYDGISHYFKLNYDVVPIGYSGKSDVNPEGQVAFLRIPKDPVDRVLTGLFDNTVSTLALKAAKAGFFGDEVKRLNANESTSLSEMLTKDLSLAASDVPGLNPLVRIAGAWADYMQGENPIDDFRGSFVLSDKEFLAGGWAAQKEMLSWTLNQTGAQNFFSYNPQQQTSSEIIIANLPIVNGIVKVTDAGYREQQRETNRAESVEQAKASLSLSTVAQQLSTEYNTLRRLGDQRSEPQNERYKDLTEWHRRVYGPTMEALLDPALDTAAKDRARKTAAKDSETYRRPSR